MGGVCYLYRLLPSQATPPERPLSKGRGARDWRLAVREAAPLMGLGTTLAVTVLAGVGAGHWLDGRFGTHPVLLLLGSGLGVGAAMLYIFKVLAGSSTKQAGPKR
jgi:F0F1-type ATP synthase assembly protein I